MEDISTPDELKVMMLERFEVDRKTLQMINAYLPFANRIDPCYKQWCIDVNRRFLEYEQTIKESKSDGRHVINLCRAAEKFNSLARPTMAMVVNFAKQSERELMDKIIKSLI